MFNQLTQHNDHFADFCRRRCDTNVPTGFKFKKGMLAENHTLNDNIELDYPTSTFYGQQFSIQQNFFGIRYRNDTSGNDQDGRSSLTANLISADMIVLLYQAERLEGWTDDDIRSYELEVTRYFESEFDSDVLRVLTMSTSYIDAEIDRAGRLMVPYAIIGLIVMMTCASISVALSSLYMQQFSWFKIAIAVFGCLCPFMASGTALGLLFFLGVRYASVLAICPFLILATGIDDVFLTIHEWQRTMRKEPLPLYTKDKMADRLSLVLVEIGSSVLISALTNILSDTVGSFTGSPEITLLCLGNIACVVVDFFYQITLFTAFLVIVGKLEGRAAEQRIALEGYPSKQKARSSDNQA
ncbi:patched family protein [Aphelenchoides avenae]|nr:patched family protein [Aphelenchus avenae]